VSAHLTILALGSRGDVQPFIALGLGLQAAGYRITLAAAADYAALVQERGLAFHALVGQISALLDPAQVEQFLGGASNPVRAIRSFMQQVNPIVDQLMRDCWAACHSSDGLIVSTLGMYCGVHLAEKLQIPLIVAHLHPYAATTSQPQMFFPPWPRRLPLRGSYNWLSHLLADHVQWQALRRPFNRARGSRLDMAPLGPLATWRRARSASWPTVYGYSRVVAPPPADWDAGSAITGYWFLDALAGWQPPAALARFLAAGPPPVLVSFGSMMVGRDADRLTGLIVAALQASGQRGIIYRGWGELGRAALPSSVLAVDALPHDWLFPQLRAVVHHGGAGVTAAALRAGRPAIVVPFLGDQHFWARRVLELGAGPPPLPRAQLSAERLAQAIASAIDSPTMAARASAVGQQLTDERGVERAVEWISDQWLVASGQ
jgi:UDP:flavonoid glycosyltransferase YjiC (YdhE family)